MEKLYTSRPLDNKEMKNAIRMLYAYGPLIGKAIGGCGISVSDELLEAANGLTADAEAASLVNGLPHEGFEATIENELSISVGKEAGLAFLDELFGYLGRVGVAKAHVKPVSNEKYAFRSLMVRIGMRGAGYRECRLALMEGLSGNASFATDVGYENFRERRRRDGKRGEAEATGASGLRG